jgi:hypothetical protein
MKEKKRNDKGVDQYCIGNNRYDESKFMGIIDGKSIRRRILSNADDVDN